MSYFAPKLFSDPKMPLMFTSVVTHDHPIKKMSNSARNSNMCGVFNGGFNGRLSILCDLF